MKAGSFSKFEWENRDASGDALMIIFNTLF